MFIRQPKKGLSLSVYVDDTSLAAKNQNIDPMCKVLMKQVDLANQPHSSTLYLGCTQRMYSKQGYFRQLQKDVRI